MGGATISSSIERTYDGKTVLVTGGQGFVGSALVKKLSKFPCRVLVLDREMARDWLPKDSSADIAFVEGDVMKKQMWESILPGVDVVFHLAAIEYDRVNYDVEKDFGVNALSVYNLLEAMRNLQSSARLIFSSSANLFGMAAEECPVSEKCPSDPPSPWSAHKYLAENYLRIYARRYGLRSLVLRLANVYGPTGRAETMTRVVLNRVIAGALADGKLRLFRNHGCLRDFIFCADAANAFARSACVDGSLFDGRFYLAGSGQRLTIGEIWKMAAEEVEKRNGKAVEIEIDGSVSLEPLDCRDFVSDSSAFKEVSGWVPEVYARQGIAMTVEALSSAVLPRA